MTTAMRAAIRPYSMAVAPDSSRRKLCAKRFIVITSKCPGYGGAPRWAPFPIARPRTFACQFLSRRKSDASNFSEAGSCADAVNLPLVGRAMTREICDRLHKHRTGHLKRNLEPEACAASGSAGNTDFAVHGGNDGLADCKTKPRAAEAL